MLDFFGKNSIYDEFKKYCELFDLCPDKTLESLIKKEITIGNTIYGNFLTLKKLFQEYPINPNLLHIAKMLKSNGSSWIQYQYTEYGKKIEISFVAVMSDGLIQKLTVDDIFIKIDGIRFFTKKQKDKRYQQFLELDEIKKERNKQHQAYLKQLQERKARGEKMYRDMTLQERLEYKRKYQNKKN
jgi:hypothetical protein